MRCEIGNRECYLSRVDMLFFVVPRPLWTEVGWSGVVRRSRNNLRAFTVCLNTKYVLNTYFLFLRSS